MRRRRTSRVSVGADSRSRVPSDSVASVSVRPAADDAHAFTQTFDRRLRTDSGRTASITPSS